MIRLSGVTKFFSTGRWFGNDNQIVALRDCSLELPRGTLVSLTGNNGSGKTTILRLIAGLLLPDQGAVSVGGQPAHLRPPAARLGYVPGSKRAFFFPLSGRENLLFHAAISGLRDREAREKVAGLAAWAGLDQHLDRQVNGYSSGMLGRLMIVRALLGNPEILLLDEPANHLDQEMTARLGEKLGQLHRAGATIIVAEPSQSALAGPADLLLQLRDGAVAEMTRRERRS